MSQNASVSGLELGALIADEVSEIVELPRVSAIMHPDDAADLRKFFATGGFAVFDQSPTASLIAMLKLRAPCKPCERCGGDLEKGEGGCGFVCSKPQKRAPTAYERELAKFIDIELPEELPSRADTLCKDCDGRGWVMGRFQSRNKPVTARPTGSSKKGGQGGVSVSDGDIALLGRVSSRIEGVRRIQGDLPAAEVIEAWYSPDGGAESALWHLVPAGKTMLRGNSSRLPPTQYFANLAEENRLKPTQKRTSQFSAAGEQARDYYVRSIQLWNTVRDGERAE